MPASPREEDPVLHVLSMQMGPTKTIDGPPGSSTLHAGLPKGHPVSCHIATLTLLGRAFKHINLKASGKEYVCGEYDKTSSNWDAVVSDYLQEYLGACLVCSEFGMSYLDPSNLWHHGRGLHYLLFY